MENKVLEDFYHLKLNNNCNSLCNFCADGPNIRKKRNYTFDDVKKLLDQAYLNGYRRLIITGGEPTISNILFKVIYYSKKLGFFVQLITNGRALSIDKIFRKLVYLGVDKYQVSFFSNREDVFDDMSGVKGAFKQVFKGLLNLSRNNQKIQFNVVVTKQNVVELFDLYLLMLSFNPEGIQFSFMNPSGFAIINKEKVLVKLEDIVPKLDKIVDYHDYLDDPVLLRFENFPLCVLSEKVKKYVSEMFYLDTEKDYRFLGKSKDLDKCKNCSMKNICGGYWDNYLKYFKI